MIANRGRDTSIELAVRKRLHARGLRYRVDVRPVSTFNRRADIVFTRTRIAVFIDGCFWHCCPIHATTPRANADYWVPKLAANAARDADTNRHLTDEGWLVMRFWEHDDPSAVAEQIEQQVRHRLAQL